MTNKIKELPKWKLAYITGIIDGEGCITISKHQGLYSPMFCVSNTEEEMLNFLCKETGLGKVYTIRRKEKGRQQIYIWNIGKTQEVYLLLSCIKDISIVKAPEIEILIPFCLDRLANKNKLRLSDQQYYRKLMKLRAFRKSRRRLEDGRITWSRADLRTLSERAFLQEMRE